MKKLLLPILLLVCLNVNLVGTSKEEVIIQKNYGINNPLPLPDGIYFLCCREGMLLLYDILFNVVGAGTDCGGLSGCYKVILVSKPSQLLPNPENPTPDFILARINSLKPANVGAKFTGSTELQTYYFLSSQVNW